MAQQKYQQEVIVNIMESYKILKVPITKDKSVFYYYKRYAGGSADPERIVELP